MTDRVSERRRAAQLARHYRDQEGLTIAEIGHRLGRAEGTVKAYLYDPIGEQAREVKARYRGACRGCGAPTSPRGGNGDAYEDCKRCRPGAIARQWTRERVREAIRAWRARYCAAPSSYDWSRIPRTPARQRQGDRAAVHEHVLRLAILLVVAERGLPHAPGGGLGVIASDGCPRVGGRGLARQRQRLAHPPVVQIDQRGKLRERQLPARGRIPAEHGNTGERHFRMLRPRLRASDHGRFERPLRPGGGSASSLTHAAIRSRRFTRE